MSKENKRVSNAPTPVPVPSHLANLYRICSSVYFCLDLGDPAGYAGLLDQFLASLHPRMEARIRRVRREVIPNRILRIGVRRPVTLGHIGRRPRGQLREDTGVVDVQNTAEQLDSVDIVLLGGIRRLAAIAQSLPPRHPPPQREKDMTKLVEEADVCLVGDLLPFNVVEVALQFAEAFDFEHAANNARKLGCEKNVTSVFGVANVHGPFLAIAVDRHKSVLGTTGHVVPLREQRLRMSAMELQEKRAAGCQLT